MLRHLQCKHVDRFDSSPDSGSDRGSNAGSDAGSDSSHAGSDEGSVAPTEDTVASVNDEGIVTSEP